MSRSTGLPPARGGTHYRPGGDRGRAHPYERNDEVRYMGQRERDSNRERESYRDDFRSGDSYREDYRPLDSYRPNGGPSHQGADNYRGGDNYRRDGSLYQEYRDDEYHTQYKQPPPPQGPPGDFNRSNPSYQFGGDVARPPPMGPSAAVDSYRPPTTDFNFRYDAPPGVNVKDLTNTFEPPPPGQRERRPRPHKSGPGAGNQGKSGGERRWQPKPKIATADRPFLKTNREPTPEVLPNMLDNEGQTAKFMPVEDLSDSEEADMDLGTDDEEQAANEPKKKQPRTESSKATDGDSVPKWSNPDPYFVLPPVDDSMRKPKDMVKLIRKARVQAATEVVAKPEEKADDFISLSLDDDDAIVIEDSDDDNTNNDSAVHGVPGAPTGPRPNAGGGGNEPRPLSERVSQPGPRQLDTSSDPTLGSRKRTHDDQLQYPAMPSRPPPQPKKYGKQPRNGKILSEWAPKGDPTPWNNGKENLDSNRMGVRLHQEVMDFYEHFKPRPFEEEMRHQLIGRLSQEIRSQYGDADVYPFGSFPSGLYLPTADMDVAFNSDRYMRDRRVVASYTKSNHIWKLSKAMVWADLASEETTEVITKAKVPLLKFVDQLTGLKVDISFENDTGIVAVHTFKKWKDQFPAMPILVTLIKQFLAMRGLNEPHSGGIGGFTVTCLVVSMLQMMPQVQSGNMIPHHHLGEMLMEFFDLYGNRFNTTTTSISLDPPGYVPKHRTNFAYSKPGNEHRLSIIDPNRPDNDISGGSSNIQVIKESFSKAYKALRDRMVDISREKLKNASILEVIIGGNYETFEYQRQLLFAIHDSQQRQRA